MEKDFYDILGLTEEEKALEGKEFEKVLKNKYKKLAIKWHPDKFATKSDEEKKKAEDKFKEISEAYDTLSDPEKKQRYDFQQGGFDPFSNFQGSPFSGFGDFFNSFNKRSHQNRPKVGRDIRVDITINLKEAFNGCEKEVEYFRNVPCSSCNGSGSKTGKTETCPHCHGTGMERIVQNNGYMQTVSMTTCRHCHGTGVINTDPCHKCNGTGVEKHDERQKVTIPAGTLPGQSLYMPGMGEVVKDGQPGGLIVVINVIDYNGFSFDRYGNIVYEKKLPIYDALLGTEFELEMLDGEKRTIKVKEVTHDNDKITIPNIGFPIYNDGRRGNVVINIKYSYPDKLNSKQRELIKKIKDKK